MGTWGAGIFSDDLASDVRGDWRQALEDGLTAEAATAKLLERYGAAADDPDEATRFWVALALVQSSTGRLQPAVRDEALRLIDAGGDVALFAEDDPKLGRARAAALTKAAAQLRGPQKPPSAIRRPKPVTSPVEIGDVLEIVGPATGRRGYFLVTDLADGWPKGTRWPVLAGLGWRGDTTPTIDDLRVAPLLHDDPGAWEDRGPVVDLVIVTGPSRGKRAWSTFATVIATGLRRSDAPSHVRTGGAHRLGEPNVGYMTWPTIAGILDMEWHDRRLARTSRSAAAQQGAADRR